MFFVFFNLTKNEHSFSHVKVQRYEQRLLHNAMFFLAPILPFLEYHKFFHGPRWWHLHFMKDEETEEERRIYMYHISFEEGS